MTGAPPSAMIGLVAGSPHAPRLTASPSEARRVGPAPSPGQLRLDQPQAVQESEVQARSARARARARAGHALSVAGMVTHRAGAPAAILALAILTLSAVAAPLPAIDGLVAGVLLVEPAGEWGGPLVRSVATAVGVLVALRAVALVLGAAGWLVFPLEHREMLAELSRRAREAGEERR